MLCDTACDALLPLPQANASALVGNRLSLLLDDDLDEVAAAAVRLKELLPNITVDKFVEYYPQVVDIDDFELALQVRHMKERVMCAPYRIDSGEACVCIKHRSEARKNTQHARTQLQLQEVVCIHT